MLSASRNDVCCCLWLLLSFLADCRWLLERRDTPWFPNMRLYRQSERGNWDSVLEEIRDDLMKLAASRDDVLV